MDNLNSMPIYQYPAPMNQSLEPPESMILKSSYELHPCLVAIGQNQPFPTTKVLSSNQEDNESKVLSSNQEGNEPKVLCSDQWDNELLATLRESFKRLINLGLDLALQDPVLLQHIYTGLNNIAFGGVFLSLSISGVRFVLISRHTPCTSHHDKLLEVKKESSPQTRRESFHSHITNFSISRFGYPSQTSCTPKLFEGRSNSTLENPFQWSWEEHKLPASWETF
jgi:hypothetical protein